MPEGNSRHFLLQPLRFLIVGALNTLTGLAIIFALKWSLGLDDFLANLIGYSAGLLISHYLNGRWTFVYSGPLARRTGRFLAVVLTAYLLNLLTVSIALSVFQVNSYFAQATGVIPYAFASFLGFKFYAYREQHA